MLFAHSFNRHFPYLLAPDGGGADGGGGHQGDQGDDPPGGTDDPTAPGGRLDPDRLKATHGGAEAALRVLAMKLNQVEADNATYRQQLKDLKGKLPGEGAVVLDGEQAAAWQAYQALGKPDELKQIQGDYTQLQRNQLFQEAAVAHGYKAAVLGQLPGMTEFTIEVKEQDKDGKKVKVAIAKTGDGQERPLPELIDEKWADFKPALVEQTATPSGTPWPKQGVSGQGAATDPVKSTLDKRYPQPESK